jgi:hypothetical protein
MYSLASEIRLLERGSRPEGEMLLVDVVQNLDGHVGGAYAD